MATAEYDVRTLIDHFDRDQRFIEEKRQEWTKEYPECWVAVYGLKMVGCASTLDEALGQAKEKGATHNVAVRLLTAKPRMFLLWKQSMAGLKIQLPT